MAAKKKLNAASRPTRQSKILVQRLPRASGITPDHIYFLLCGSKLQASRLLAYGKLNRRILRNIGRPALHDGTVGKI